MRMVILKLLLAIYLLGFVGIFWLTLFVTPNVTFALAAAQASTWPTWIGWREPWPRGVRLETYCPPDPDECG